MLEQRRGVARKAITAALALSMSLGGVPTIAFAEDAKSDQPAIAQQAEPQKQANDSEQKAETTNEQKTEDDKKSEAAEKTDEEQKTETPSEQKSEDNKKAESTDKTADEQKTAETGAKVEDKKPEASAKADETGKAASDGHEAVAASSVDEKAVVERLNAEREQLESQEAEKLESLNQEAFGLVAAAEDELVSQATSGTWGECAWELDDEGTLTVHPGAAGERFIRRPWSGIADQVKVVKFVEEDGKKVVAPESLFNLFYGFKNLETVDLSGLDTSNVTDMSWMFASCESLQSIDLSGLDTRQVTTMSRLFQNCTALEAVSLSGVDLRSLTDMSSLFTWCQSLKTVDLSGINTSSVTDMSWMFAWCESLKSLDLSGFDTSRVTDMSDMFFSCSRLESVNVSSFRTASVTNFSDMFGICEHLVKLDLSNWEIGQDANVSLMFGFDYLLQQVSVSSHAKKFGTLPAFDYYATPESVDEDGNLRAVANRTKGHTDWFSQAEKKWFTAQEIAESRQGIADTYTKTEDEVPVYDPTDEELKQAPKQENTDDKTNEEKTGDDSSSKESNETPAARSIVTEVRCGEGAPTVTSANLAEVAPKLLTAAELARFNAGEDAKVWVRVELVTNETANYASAEEMINGIKTKYGFGVSGTYDITLWKQIGTDTPVQVKDTGDNAIQLKLSVPESMRNTDGAVTRTFYLYRTHIADDATYSFDELAETTNVDIEFGSNKFSYYMLGYIDTPVETGNGGGTTTTTTTYRSTTTPSTGSTTTSKTTTTTPKTGDASVGGALAIMLAGAAATLAGILWARRKK